MVSLSLDSDLLDEQQAAAAVEASSSRQQQLQPGPGLSSSSDSSSEAAAEALLLSATASTLGDLRLPGQLSPTVRRLLADSISLNSTASIRLAAADDPGRAPAAAADTSDGGSDSGSEGAVAAVAPAAVVGSSSSSSSGSRQLDRSGNRTECALLEFGGRLEGRLLPGSGSSEQAAAVLQVFPFSSTRKRMSSLVALGPPLPGLHGGGAAADGGPGSGQQQPARLYVKGAAELLLDSCRLQVRVG
jgi:magnesium-transporting ATPase (P-type)